HYLRDERLRCRTGAEGLCGGCGIAVIEAWRLLVTGDLTLRAITNPVTFADPLMGRPRASATSPALTGRRQSSTRNDSALLVSAFGWWRRANLIVPISLLERTE